MNTAPPLRWMKFWYADFLSETDHLDDAAFRAYFRLYCAYWQRQGLPADLPQLQRLAQLGGDPAGTVESVVGEFFRSDGAFLKQDKLDAVLTDVLSAAEVNRVRGAKAREAKANRNTVTPSVTEPATTSSKETEERGEKREERGNRQEGQKTEAEEQTTEAERQEADRRSALAQAERDWKTAAPEDKPARKAEFYRLRRKMQQEADRCH